ncbi:uncharacterized protein Mitofilin [Epargyreus clarus]|uniref:uncharacterized protein Mitofilin n=1 Tax=Epargyreus clarus TaxID=520877 RepID=UPI003C3021A0
MYKFTNHVTNANLVLVRKQLSDGSCAALIVMRAPRRRYAQESCPPPRPAVKSRKLLWGTIGATVLTGAAVVYAKNTPEARNFLESNVPWANNFIALIYQENTTYWKFSVNQFNKITTAIGNFMFGKEGITPRDFQQRSEQDIEKDAAKAAAKKDYELPPPTFEPLYFEEKKIETPDVDTPATMIQTDRCEPQSLPPIKITKDMVELEHDMHENTKIAIDNYKKATEHCHSYNRALFRVVEASLDDLDRKFFSALQGAKNERDTTIKKAKEASAKAKCAIETLDRMIKAGVQAPPESVAATQRYIKQFRADLSNAEFAYKEEFDKAVLSDKYWNKVEAARKAYKEELEMLFPGIDLSARQLDIRGDTDLLLMYTLKQIQYLQSEIAEMQTVRDLKMTRAIECHDEKALIEAKVEDEIKKERLQKEKEFQKRSLEIQAEANRKLKEQLKKQFEIQQEVLQDRLAKKEKEVMGKFSRSVSEQVEKERVQFKKELAAMAGKLKAIEQTLKQRAKAEAEARRSQSLWAAAEALLAATRRTVPETKVDNEIKALEKAGKDDKLVQTILKGIPQDVREKGIVTEKSLRERFDKLEQTAVKVALVGRDGAALPVYFLSWLQSKLLFQKFAEIPKDELDNLPTDFSQLDTFDIIQRARYHMDHGDLPVALRYVNLLQGAPRAVARDWAAAARAHLETRQAALAVMAHASIAGLLYILLKNLTAILALYWFIEIMVNNFVKYLSKKLIKVKNENRNFSIQKLKSKMYRIANHWSNARIILNRHRFDVHIVNATRAPGFDYSVKERDTCPPPPPPPKPKPRDDSIFWGALTVVCLAGGFAAYARRSPEIRDWLTIHLPWFDDLIAIVYEENMSYKDFAELCIDDAKKYYKSLTTKDDNKPKQCSMESTPKLVRVVPDPPKEDIIVGPKQPPVCEILPPPVITKNICEIEECLREFGETAINNYNSAKEACAAYNKLVEKTMLDFSIPKVKELHTKMAERLDATRDMVEKAVYATAQMDELTRYLECGVEASRDAIENTKCLMSDYHKRIKAALIKYQWENDLSVALDDKWQKVEELINMYADENQTMFSGLQYAQKKLQLNGDADLLLHHTYRYTQKLKAELEEVVAGMSERVDRGIETLCQSEKEKKARDCLIDSAIKRRRMDMDKEFKQRYDDLKACNEKTMKDALQKQCERHQEVLKQRLKQKEDDMMSNFNTMVSEKVDAEKKVFIRQLNDMALKLKVVEDKLNARLKAESESRRSQELYIAGTSLLAAIKKGEPYVNVEKELKAIEKASGDGDKLVATVLKAIPQSVWEVGVVPESVLREKYREMEKVALKVALVEQDGAPLPVYMLSWLQSKFLFMKLSTIPQIEIDKPPMDPPFKDLDTFDLLQRASYWMERGNVAAAIRYVSSLQGASRAAAASWFEAARAHLETRQAAEAVLAHAAALALQYI